MSKVPHYYLNGCSGVIYVADLSRPDTYDKIDTQLTEMRNLLGKIEIVLAANKVDLLEEAELSEVLKKWEVQPDITTSAKFDQNVEEMFNLLATKLVKSHES